MITNHRGLDNYGVGRGAVQLVRPIQSGDRHDILAQHANRSQLNRVARQVFNATKNTTARLRGTLPNCKGEKKYRESYTSYEKGISQNPHLPKKSYYLR
jgi:hypothetical protein